MKHILALCAFILVGTVGWQLGGRLSSDAIGMALGILFGIMAMVPLVLMAFAMRNGERYEDPEPRRQPPPVIVGRPAIVVNNYSLTVAPIDPRLNFTGEVTMDGYHLAQCAVGTKVSQIAAHHDGYSVTRFGSRIGLKPLNNEAARQIEAKAMRSS